jgi:hypothetical protein
MRGRNGKTFPRDSEGPGSPRGLCARPVARHSAHAQAFQHRGRPGRAANAGQGVLPGLAPRDPRRTRGHCRGRHCVRHVDGPRGLATPQRGLRLGYHAGRAAHHLRRPTFQPADQEPGRSSGATAAPPTSHAVAFVGNTDQGSSFRTRGARSGAPAASRSFPTKTTCCTRPTCESCSSASRSNF